MIIGIDGSRAFIEDRTGIEEYSYQIIKNLRDKLDGHQVVLYIRSGQSAVVADCPLVFPDNWKIKVINCVRLWTQLGLAWEMFAHPVDALFVPAHTVPWIHPKKTIVTVHGLEYEIVPQAYSFWERLYMRRSIKNSCLWAEKIVSVSDNTKRDLIRLYHIPENKIEVVYNGYDADANFQFPISNFQTNPNDQILNSKYLFFIGRLEERKNILGIIRAFEILKERYNIPHKLVLAGKFGHGEEKIQAELKKTNSAQDIILLGYLKLEEKFSMLAQADVFMFPTYYEGFGIPILEAQGVGVPVVTSNVSSMPEVAGDSALLVNPANYEEIAEAAYKLISNKDLKDDIIKRGYENVQRFSWIICAQKIGKILVDRQN